MHRLAMYTFGLLNAPFHSDQPSIQQFLELAGLIYGGIADSPGYIAHAMPDDFSKSQFDADWGSWGEYAVPDWYRGGREAGDFAAASTLSLWTDVESVHTFTYGAHHRTALNRRREWFHQSGHSPLVMWWTAGEETPQWKEGIARLAALDARGPEHTAFSFRRPFSADGEPLVLRSIEA